MIAGQLEIQLMANIARLQDDMSKAQSTVDRAMGGIKRSADVAVKALAALGVGLSAAALTGFIRGAIDAADEISKLSQKIGIGVESVAGLQLAFRQSGISASSLQSSMSRLSREIAAGNDAFNAMGISIRSSDGALKSSRQVLGELADKFAEYEDGVAKTALAMDIFGKAGAELIPLLNGGSAALDEFDAMASKLGLTLSEETAKRAERFNDTLDLMGQGMHGIGRQIAAEMLPTFNALADQFFTTLTEGDRLKGISDSLSVALRGLTSAGIGVVGAFQAAGNAIGGVSAMIVRVFEGDFNAARIIAGQLRDDLSGGFRSTIDSMTKAWTAQGSAAFESMAKVNKQLKEQAPLIEKSNDGLEKRAGAIKKQVNEADKLAKIEERRVEQIKAEGMRLTESLDPLVKRNNEIDRYKTLLESGAISEGIYSQAVERSTEDYLKALGFVEREIESIDISTKDLQATTNKVFDSMEQIAIQGVRNIQSSFADGIFNFFDNGLKGMVDSVITAVGRIAAEFASIKLLQGAGGLLGIGGASTAFASGGGGSIASLGSNLFNTGFGATSAISGLGSMLPGSVGSFFTGMGISGGGAAASAAGFSGAASMGASFAAAAGPLIALAAVDQIGRLLAGDKRTGSFVDSVPVIGGFAGALFGHGPMKFREQQLRGNASASGFAGEFVDVSRAKGGLLVGNKHQRVGAENEADILELFDTAIKGFSKSARGFAETLGLDASAIDDYSKKIFIRSQKTKQFTEEEIGGILSGIGDDLARKLIPEIDQFSRSGESAMVTLQRLNDEFGVLVTAATMLGHSVADAREFINGVAIDSRSAFVEMAGGADALSQKASFFADNFLSDAERMQPAIDILSEEMSALGLSADMSKEQFKSLVQSFGQVNGISQEMLVSLLNIAPLFIQVKNSIDSLGTSLEKFDAGSLLGTAFANLEKSVSKERERITVAYNKQIDSTRSRISALNETVNKFKSLSEGLRGAADAIRGMSASTARQQLLAAIGSAASGMFPDMNKLQPALQALQGQGASGFSTREAMAMDRAENAKLVDSLGDLVDEQLVATQKMLKSSEEQLDALTFGFGQEMSRLDNILSVERAQVDQLMGINTNILSLTDAILAINSARNAVVNAGAGVASPAGVLAGAGNASITDADILNYVQQVGGDPDKILQAAIQYGVSASQYSAATGASMDDIREFAASRGITGFASGGNFKGGVRIVGEYGPELERTGPSRIYSNSDSKGIFDADGIKDAINKLTEVVAIGNKEQRRNADILDRVTLGGTSFRTVTA